MSLSVENYAFADSDKITSPLKAIRAKCLDCSNQSPYEVNLCPVERCPLYPFRLGKNPFIASRRSYWDDLTDEQKNAIVEKLRSGREAYKQREKERFPAKENGSE